MLTGSYQKLRGLIKSSLGRLLFTRLVRHSHNSLTKDQHCYENKQKMVN